MVKYVLIISQYYHSHIQKICMVQDDFIEKARNMIRELEDYKRSPHEREHKPVYYGDLDGKSNKRIGEILEKGGRLNLNDAGDIYFIFSDSLNYLVNNVVEYAREEEKRYIVNSRSKEIMEAVSEHHSKAVVTNIIKGYFVIM